MMKTGKMTEPEVNRVLRETFRDDLEAGLGERLRGEMRETWRLGAFSLRAPEGKPETRAWPAGRMLAAATALAMLAAGGALHYFSNQSPMANALALRQAATAVTGQLNRATQMSCLVETCDAVGRPLRYSLSWRESGGSRVEIDGPGGRQVRTARQPAARTRVMQFSRAQMEAAEPAPEGASDPLLAPVRDYLSPHAVAGLLAGRWRMTGPEGFEILEPDEGMRLRITIDPATRLPLRLEAHEAGTAPRAGTCQPLLKASFQWQALPAIGRS